MGFKCPLLTSDITLTGHEHVSTKTLLDNLEGDYSLRIEGAVLQNNLNKEESEFNIIQFDIDNKAYRIENCKWLVDHYSNNIDEKQWVSCEKKFIRDFDKLHFTPHHYEWLTNVGANFTHPYKNNLKLSDLFIYPNLKELTQNLKNDDKNGIINLEQVIKELNYNSKNLIIGSEKAGKTTICKVIIQDLHRRGFYPVYLKGRKLNSPNIQEFRKYLKNSYCDQYQWVGAKEFEQISENKIYLIIDNFDRATINTKFKNKLIHEITRSFDNIIITGNDLLAIQEIFSEDSAENIFSNYKQHSVLEFGHLLRHKLVNNWNLLGRTEQISDEELVRKNNEAERLIDSIIGPNFIPSHPIFLLTLLQTIEAGTTHDLKESSYGHYYQVLIISSLGKIVKGNEEIDKYYTYLTELAFYFFSNQSNEITMDEFEKFHKQHYERYKTKMRIGETLDILSQASIIDKYDDSIAFKYRYVYYFFVAKYLADNLSYDTEKQIISKMCTRLYDSHCANITLFLTHHTKDIFVLSEIAKVANKQFDQFEIVKLDNDVVAINKLIDKIPEIAYEHKNIESHREEILKQKDKVDEENNIKNEELKPVDLSTNDLVEVDIISQLNAAFKTLEILGQVLKNHYASIKAVQKVELIEEAYFIGLRTLNSFFKVFEESNEFIVNQINDYIDKHNIDADKYKMQDVGRKIVFNVGCHVAYNFIKKIHIRPK